MRQIYTGKGHISILSLIAIWSISLVVDLPGLAISPLMSQLDTIFPDASELEIQLFTALPNFFIFPFILLSGKLSVSKSKALLVDIGLLLFLIGGICCFFSDKIIPLIILNCLLGIGCGLVIPLAAGLLAEYFTGPYRSRQLGIKSGIANFSLIFATFIVGAIGKHDWHLPFIVYLAPIIPLILSPFFTKKFLDGHSDAKGPTAEEKKKVVEVAEPPLNLTKTQIKSRVWSIIAFYFIITFCSIVVSMFIPFLMQKHGMSDTQTGIVTAVFFLFITLPGFFLSEFVGIFKKLTSQMCIIFLIVGLFMIALMEGYAVYLIASAIIGLGYGALQPLFYDKAARVAPTSNLSSLYLSFVMSANYIGIAVSPFIINLMKDLFHNDTYTFPFYVAGVIMIVMLVLSVIRYKAYVFHTDLIAYKNEKQKI